MALNVKLMLLSLLAGFASFASPTTPGPHDHHKRHFMVLAGETEVFAYHYVYKVPHNYQVILKVNFDEATKSTYLAEKAAHPKETFFYYFDPMVIADVASVTELSGSLVREDASGTQFEILKKIVVPRADFEVLFFDEVPLKLD